MQYLYLPMGKTGGHLAQSRCLMKGNFLDAHFLSTQGVRLCENYANDEFLCKGEGELIIFWSMCYMLYFLLIISFSASNDPRWEIIMSPLKLRKQKLKRLMTGR